MRTKWLILTISGIFVLMLVAAWLQFPKPAPLVSPPPLILHTYTDPHHVFSVSVPSTWTITPSSGSSTIGLHTLHPVHQSIQITQFTKPAEMGLTVQVISGKPSCPLVLKPTTTIAGLPASFDPATHTWSLPTASATVLVSVAYPGSHSFHGPVQHTAPTPFPAETVAADKQLVSSLLASLKFPNLKPFSCE